MGRKRKSYEKEIIQGSPEWWRRYRAGMKKSLIERGYRTEEDYKLPKPRLVTDPPLVIGSQEWWDLWHKKQIKITPEVSDFLTEMYGPPR